jgi:hypothetical protein
MTVATLDLSPEVLAQKSGSCPHCPEPIVKGDTYIRAVLGLKRKLWMHSDCAAAHLRHLEEFRELSRDDGDGWEDDQ